MIIELHINKPITEDVCVRTKQREVQLVLMRLMSKYSCKVNDSTVKQLECVKTILFHEITIIFVYLHEYNEL